MSLFAEWVSRKMEKKRRAQTLDSNMKRSTPKSVLPPSCTDLAPSSSPLVKDKMVEADRWNLKQKFRFCHCDRRNTKMRSAWPPQADRPNRTIQPPPLSLTPSRPSTVAEKGTSRMILGLKCFVQWATASVIHCTTTITALPINRLSMTTVSQRASVSGKNDFKYK